MQAMNSMPMRVLSLVCRPIAIPLFAAALGLTMPANADGPDAPLVGANLPPHPRLLLNAQGVAELKQRIATTSWASASWNELKAGVDRSLSRARSGFVWDTLNENERQALTDKVLRPALEQVIIPRRLGIHNIQCRHNSAIGLVGLLLGDDKLITRAIDDS